MVGSTPVPMTLVDQARADYDAARARLHDALKLSTQALLAGGFRFVETNDPLRNEVLDEIEAESKGEGREG
jgi:hypothetical protein